MKINAISNYNNGTTFGSVTPILATPKGAEKLKEVLTTSKGQYLLEDITDLYKNTEHPYYKKAFSQGKKFLCLVTGNEYKKYMYMEHDWSTRNALTRHFDRKLINITEKTNAAIAILFKRVNMNTEYSNIVGHY